MSEIVNDGFKQLQCIDSETKHLVHGYLREQKHKLFPNNQTNNAYFNLHAMVTVILKYSVGLITLQIKSDLLHNHFDTFNCTIYQHATIKDLLHFTTKQMKLSYPSNVVKDYVISHGGIQLDGKRTLKQCDIDSSATFTLRERSKRVVSVKVGMLGDKKSGKTSLLLKHIEDKFEEEYIPTIGVNVMEKSFELKNCVANLQLYDHGQYKNMLTKVTKDANAMIFVFDLTEKSSLYSIKKLYKEARKVNKLFKAIFVGTKYDLFEQMDDGYKSEVIELSRKYAQKMHSPLIMCSSKTNIHIKQIYTVVIGSVFQIKIKSKQKHKDPILEYDIIYSK
eukprot:474119_1